jgi:hypothetical protein
LGRDSRPIRKICRIRVGVIVLANEDEEALPSPEESFRQAWLEINTGKTRPVSELWEGIDAELVFLNQGLLC